MASEPSSSSVAANGGDYASVPASHRNNECSTPASSAIGFLTLCHRLKSTKRTGWVRRYVQDPESIVDHMYRIGIMALIVSGVDRDKCVKMAIVHDIAEGCAGEAWFDSVAALDSNYEEDFQSVQDGKEKGMGMYKVVDDYRAENLMFMLNNLAIVLITTLYLIIRTIYLPSRRFI